jgi:hypothetical protein
MPHFTPVWSIHTPDVLNYHRLATELFAGCATECGEFSPIKSSGAHFWRHTNARD